MQIVRGQRIEGQFVHMLAEEHTGDKDFLCYRQAALFDEGRSNDRLCFKVC